MLQTLDFVKHQYVRSDSNPICDSIMIENKDGNLAAILNEKLPILCRAKLTLFFNNFLWNFWGPFLKKMNFRYHRTPCEVSCFNQN